MENDQKNIESLLTKEDHKKDDATPKSYPIKNIVLLGSTRNGKSATGNSIARQHVFTLRSHATHDLMECQKFKTTTPEGPILNLIDTPGLLNVFIAPDIITKEIIRCLNLAEGGIHAAILVLSARTRFTKDEEMVVRTLESLFGSRIFNYLIIIFSSGDVLEENGMTLEEYLENCPDFLKRLLVLCGQRMTLFDNKTKDEAKKTKQVSELLNLIDLVGKQNNNKPYTDEMYHNKKEENDKYKKEPEELGSKRNLEEIIEALKKELELTRQQNIKAMIDMEENNRKIKEQENRKSKRHSEEIIDALKKELEIARQENLKTMTDMENLFELKEQSLQQLFELKEKSLQQLFEQREKLLEQSYHEKVVQQKQMNEKVRQIWKKNIIYVVGIWSFLCFLIIIFLLK